MQSNTAAVVHIALAVNDESGTYYRHSLVTLASIFAHTASHVHVHILHDDTLLEKIPEYSALCARYGHSISLYNLEKYDFSQCGDVERWGKGTLYRIVLQEHILVDRLIYLDCDIVANLDIAELYAVDLEGAALGVVHEKSVMDDRRDIKRIKSLGTEASRYFNAGVLLLNLHAIRTDHADLTQSLFSLLSLHGLRYPDQDAFNIYSARKQGAVAYLDERYNLTLHSGDYRNREFSFYQGKILHFTGHKPWARFYPAAIFYWQAYALAFPEQDAFAAMQKTRLHEKAYLFSYLLRHPKVMAFVRRMHDIAHYGFVRSMLRRIRPERW